MDAQNLLNLLIQLDKGIWPATGKPFDLTSSCLAQPDLSAGLTRFKGQVQQHLATKQDSVPDAVLRQTYDELVSMGYQPTAEQLVRVLRASRSIGDRGLRAVGAYGQYRDQFSKAYLRSVVASFATRHPRLFGGEPPVTDIARSSTHPAPAPSPKLTGSEEPATPAGKRRKPVAERAPYLNLPFFRENNFDNLSDDKAAELAAEVKKLGYTKPTEKLPAFMGRARRNYPRAYEPWSRAEQALLIEAMCYTNDAEKIAKLFGRTAKSVTATGLKLIWDSQQRQKTA